MEIKLKTKTYAKIQLSPQDSRGNPAELDDTNPIKAEIISGDAKILISPLPEDNGRFVFVVAGLPGRTEGVLEGDAEPGVEELVISEPIFVDVSAPNAVTLGPSIVLTGDVEDLPQAVKDIINPPA